MTQKLFSKNFTLLVLGQVSSLFGNFILKFALSMYVLEVTGSAAIFAGILAAATVPTILISPLGGILADRANRRNIMVALDALTGVSVLLAAVAFQENRAITVVSVLLVELSILGAFESPTVQACVPQMQKGDNIIRANAIVNQVAAVAALIAPILGSMVYTAFGVRPVMYASVVCFGVTALFECFIKLEFVKKGKREKIFSIIKNDFRVSMRFICKEERVILQILLLAALVSFFVMGAVVVGLPYIVRTILGLGAGYYGAAESMLGVAAVLGSVAAGLLIGKLKMSRLSAVIAVIGAFIIPAGVAFLFQTDTVVQYAACVAAFCGAQLAACVFSIFAISYIQQKTPNHLIGKVMAYVSAIALCAQPLGQMAYGLLFDFFRGHVYLVLIPTGVIVCIIGFCTRGFFEKTGKNAQSG